MLALINDQSFRVGLKQHGAPAMSSTFLLEKPSAAMLSAGCCPLLRHEQEHLQDEERLVG